MRPLRRIERRKLRALGGALNLADMLEHHAQVFGQRTAVLDGHEQLDYSTLNRRVDRLASALAAGGAVPGDRIAVRMPNGHRYLECLFGCARAGLVLAPVHRTLPPTRSTTLPGTARPASTSTGSRPTTCSPRARARSRTSRGPAAAIRSCRRTRPGRTGRPKGVVLSHLGGPLHLAHQILGWGLRASDRRACRRCPSITSAVSSRSACRACTSAARVRDRPPGAGGRSGDGVPRPNDGGVPLPSPLASGRGRRRPRGSATCRACACAPPEATRCRLPRCSGWSRPSSATSPMRTASRRQLPCRCSAGRGNPQEGRLGWPPLHAASCLRGAGSAG